tara:strand:- start:3877 stop:4053 length:177 start_codon:yes stop_codon:yes gene_type:complete
MTLIDAIEKLKNKKNYDSRPGTADIIHEIYIKSEKDESGRIPIIIRPEPEELKKKKPL